MIAIPVPNIEDQLAKLQKAIANDIADFICTQGQDSASMLFEIQPPDSVSKLAAEAAAAVLMAFERGYRLEV